MAVAATLILLRDELDGRALRAWLLEGHRHAGLLVLLLFGVRVWLRIRYGKLQPGGDHSRIVRAAAGVTHIALYALLLALPSAAALSRPEREYSERTAQAIDEEIRLTLDQSAERARQTLLGQRARLDRLAQLLLENEVVERHALDALMRAEGATAPHDEPVMQ